MDITIQRQRAAWDLVRGGHKDLPERLASLPVEIRTRGLCTALAILLREGTPENRQILDALHAWLKERPWLTGLRLRDADTRSLLEHLLREGAGNPVLLELTEQEALEFLGHARLLARAWKS